MTEQKAQVKIDTVEKNYDRIQELVGEESYVSWDDFTKTSTETVKAIDELGKTLSFFREAQHKNFIQTMKKLKSLDVPDLIKTVKSKKLPKEALRGVLGRFKLNGQQLELVETSEQLKNNAIKELEKYIESNKAHCEQIKRINEYFNEKIKESGIILQKPSEIKQIKATVQFNLSQQKVQSLASGIQIQYLPNTHKLIGLKTYQQIVDASYDLIKSQYEKLTNQSRKIQREVLKDSKQYLKVMNDYLLNSEALIIEAQSKIAHKVGIEGKKLQESQIALMERGLAQNILMIQSQLRARIKESMPPLKDVEIGVAKQVIEFQTKMIGEKSEYIKEVLSGLEKNQQSTQLIPMLLALILNDMVYDKYGYEQEDFMKNVGENVIHTNPELGNIFRDMEIAIIKLMQKLQVIPEEIGQYMEATANQRGQPGQGQIQQGGMMPPGMMPGMLPPGMMPGSGNPMDILQMQQMQQMQQMFGSHPQQQKK